MLNVFDTHSLNSVASGTEALARESSLKLYSALSISSQLIHTVVFTVLKPQRFTAQLICSAAELNKYFP